MYNKLLLLTDLLSNNLSNRLHSVLKDHEVETSSAIALLTFAMKKNLNFQNISAHKGQWNGQQNSLFTYLFTSLTKRPSTLTEQTLLQGPVRK